VGVGGTGVGVGGIGVGVGGTGVGIGGFGVGVGVGGTGVGWAVAGPQPLTINVLRMSINPKVYSLLFIFLPPIFVPGVRKIGFTVF